MLALASTKDRLKSSRRGFALGRTDASCGRVEVDRRDRWRPDVGGRLSRGGSTVHRLRVAGSSRTSRRSLSSLLLAGSHVRPDLVPTDVLEAATIMARDEPVRFHRSGSLGTRRPGGRSTGGTDGRGEGRLRGRRRRGSGRSRELSGIDGLLAFCSRRREK